MRCQVGSESRSRGERQLATDMWRGGWCPGTCDDEWEVGARGSVVALEGCGHAFRQISVDELRNVFLLFEKHTVRVSGYVHVE
eukprot:4254898-Pleurochrysis_carterae.AAC.1